MIHMWAVDPGKISGWCHLSVHEGEVSCFNSGETDHIGIGNMLSDNQALISASNKKEIELTIAVEKFVMNAKISPQPWSLETIGLIRYFAARYQIPFVEVLPSAHKNLISDDVIKRAGLWTPGKGHARDAVSVALWFLIAKRGLLKEYLKETNIENSETEENKC